MVPRDELEDDAGRPLGRWLIIVVVVAIAIPMLLFGLSRPAPEIVVAPGKPAPEFELPTLSKEGTLSSEELKGSIVVLNFWWSGCPPCREEVPVLVDAYERYKDEGVVVLGVDVLLDSEAAARDFMEAFDVSYPVVRDATGSLARTMKINDRALPLTFFIDEDWAFARIEARSVLTQERQAAIFGGVTEEQLETQLEAMLSD